MLGKIEKRVENRMELRGKEKENLHSLARSIYNSALAIFVARNLALCDVEALSRPASPT
jgi:hypothetical protein